MKTIIVLCMLLISNLCFAQVKYYFSSCDLAIYKQAVYQGGKYEPMYSNEGLIYESGKVILDKKQRTFTVKWSDGTDWICKYNKADTLTNFEFMWGIVHKTMYSGKWMDTNVPCMLSVIETPSDGTQIGLFTNKVVDEDYNLDCWKKKFWLHLEPLVPIGK